MMRQAGRYLPEYRAIRANHDFLTLCRNPELAAEVTVQPVDLVGVDAAIIFADILLVPDVMGAQLRFEAGEGPVFDRPVRNQEDIDALERPDVEQSLGYVFEALRVVRKQLDGRVPLIGFAGTPWTLAAYLVEGGVSKSHAHLLGWSHRDPAGLGRLLDRLADVTIDYLLGQIEAGAQALQLFDTWGGLLDARRWREIAMPPLLRILEGIGTRVPRIFYGRNTGHLLPELSQLPIEVLSVDWRIPLDQVRAQVGDRLVLQGNLDPTVLLSSPERIEAATREVITAGRGGGHVVNLGHGILPMTPPAHAQAFIDAVHQHGTAPARKNGMSRDEAMP